MTDVSFAVDEHGAPVLLAAVGEQPPSPPPAKQPAPDPGSGSQARRRDAVADAARTLDDLSPVGVEQFVRRRWRGDRAVTPEDVASFSRDARSQRVHDVVDALDHRIRRAVHGRNGSRQVHVSIPRGLATKSLSQLEAEDVRAVYQRLRDRGWTDQQIKRHGVRRLDGKDRRLQSLLEPSS